jgi:hypothetical protein
MNPNGLGVAGQNMGMFGGQNGNTMQGALSGMMGGWGQGNASQWLAQLFAHAAGGPGQRWRPAGDRSGNASPGGSQQNGGASGPNALKSMFANIYGGGGGQPQNDMSGPTGFPTASSYGTGNGPAK